ncbi:unnamed protein product, partial [Symbiodinium microadriaticum]
EGIAKRQLQLALEQQELAQDQWKKATEAGDQAKQDRWKKEVEAAKKEVEAAKKEVEAAKKEVDAAENKVNASPAQVKLPELQEFKANEMLDVSGFRNFVAPNTTADRPLFLRKHLLNVHTKAVKTLTVEKIRFVSLVGCPGTGKTWCGWLVAYTLQKADTKTLHLTIRNTDVTAIADFKEAVCIVDVSMNKPDAALDIFTGIQQLIERNQTEFAGVKFMGLLSGHGQEKITGKQLSLQVIQKLVLWSWSEEEVATLCTKLKDAGLEPPSDEAYKVCGGSVRYLFRHEEEARRTRDAVKGLSPDEMKRLLALDMPLDDQQGKNRSRLLSFFPVSGASNAVDESFAEGVSEARPMPRSDFVIKCIKENKSAKFEDVLAMYTQLEQLNAGAAGSTFELLVHLFWRDAVVRKNEVTLTLGKQGTVDHQHVSVNCSQFIPNPGRIEDYDAEGTVFDHDLVGYFTPVNPRYPVLDSILRYKLAGETKCLAIQISIASKHKHGQLEPLPKLLPPPPAATKLQLALWDFPKGGKPCEWDPKDSDKWELLHVSCPAFDERMGFS